MSLHRLEQFRWSWSLLSAALQVTWTETHLSGFRFFAPRLLSLISQTFESLLQLVHGEP
jgi:hypothetical protein